ncbi:MAG: hypothetical protein KAJ40_08040 [Alphaproteobacteria bacterium]|nr:hypothetical protein [Alphaproteobacteria bacterium]
MKFLRSNTKKVCNKSSVVNCLCKQQGSALVYILIAIALLAALTVTFTGSSSQQTSSQNSFRTVSDLKSQIDTIRSAIQECVLSYPKGDIGIDISSSGTDPYARRNFPIKPDSTHYSSATIGPTSGRLVNDIRCSGNPGSGDVNHVRIFKGGSGKFLPPSPDMFEDWQYYNGVDGVYFWIQTEKTDAFINTTLEKLDDQFGECEADVINATSGAINLDSDGDTKCDSGYRCFRVRMTISDSAIYSGDDEGDESAASCP